MLDIIKYCKDLSACDAFSLIELLAVITIFSILAAIAAPAYVNYRKYANANTLLKATDGARFALTQEITGGTDISSINYNSKQTDFVTAPTNVGTICVKEGKIIASTADSAVKLYLVPSISTNGTENTVNWECQSDPAITNLVPDECRNAPTTNLNC